MGKLNTYVHVVERDENGNELHNRVFGPDDDLPDWAVKAITNPDVWAEGGPATDDSGGISEAGAQPERPRGNASREAWSEYAGKLDPPVDVTDDMDRAAIIAAVDAR